MQRARVAVVLAVLAVLGVSAAAAFAAAKPSTGTWKLVAGPYTGTTDGTFRVIAGTGSHRGSLYVTDLKISSVAKVAGCSDAAFKQSGRIKMRTFSNAGYTSWGVGRKGPANQVNTTPVTLVSNGKRVRGGLELVWDAERRNSLFSIQITVGDCLMQPSSGGLAKS